MDIRSLKMRQYAAAAEMTKAENAALKKENEARIEVLKAEIEELKRKRAALDLEDNIELREIERLKAENEALKKENKELKAAKTEAVTRALDDYLANAKKDQLINFDDANYEYFWTASCGDVCLWKVPNDLYALEHPECGGSRVQQAFMDELFGEEWGGLSSFGVRTMTKADLIEADGIEDEEEYSCANCGHVFANEEDWAGRCDEHSCEYCECDCEDCANEELNAAIDASGNALH